MLDIRHVSGEMEVVPQWKAEHDWSNYELYPQILLEMTRHCGYTGHHAIFALLHIALLGWFLYATPHVPRLLRSLISASAVVVVAFHALLGSVCALPGWRWFLFFLAMSPIISAVAANFIALKLKGARQAKLVLVLARVLVLASTLVSLVLLVWWWWTYDPSSYDFSSAALRVALLPIALSFSSLTFIYSASKSRM